MRHGRGLRRAKPGTPGGNGYAAAGCEALGAGSGGRRRTGYERARIVGVIAWVPRSRDGSVVSSWSRLRRVRNEQ